MAKRKTLEYTGVKKDIKSVEAGYRKQDVELKSRIKSPIDTPSIQEIMKGVMD